MREEIDAMPVPALKPVDLRVLQRRLALVIWLPILGYVANMTGMFGGRLLAGLTKAPVLAMIIAGAGATGSGRSGLAGRGWRRCADDGQGSNAHRSAQARGGTRSAAAPPCKSKNAQCGSC